VVRAWSRWDQLRARTGGRLGEGFLHAGEARDNAVNAGQGQDPRDGAVGRNDQAQLTAFALGSLMRRDQGMDR
jgi:hypothetical protein